VATEFPRDATWFLDSFHLDEPGVRLHAWLVFLRLTSILARDLDRLASKRYWPSPRRSSPMSVMPGCLLARLPLENATVLY
jgi:hypothetical protein